MNITFFILAALLLFPLNSHAYIDPGAGSALIQGLIGIVVAAGVALKLYWHRVIKFLGFKKSTPKDDSKKDQ
jgi:hypothetical protein